MMSYLTELLSVTVALATGFPIMLYPLWSADLSKRAKTAAAAYLAANAVIMCLALYIARQHAAMDINALNMLKVRLLVPQVIPPLILFRKRIWHALYLAFIWLMYGPIQTGIGNYLAEIWFPDNHALYSSFIIIGVVIVTYPLLIYMLRRICQSPDAGRATTFWRLAWIVPATFYLLIIIQGTYISGSGFGAWFITVRLISYVMTLLVCYMFDVVTRQLIEAKVTQEENECLRARVETMLQSIQEGPEIITKGHLTLKPASMIALVGDEDMRLSPKEFALLLFFVRREGDAMSPEYIYEKVWGQPMESGAGAVKTAVSKLRRKLTASGYTITVKRNMGYCFEPE